MPHPVFSPILAGASLRDRAIGSLGGLIGIAATALLANALLGGAFAPPLLVAPMGASAVLVFAVPASPLAQPWPVIGGNTLSVLVGITAAALIPNMPLAAGAAVGGAILLMSLLRCLHPPGGAAALTAVIGGPAILAAGWRFALVPVAADAIILTVAGLLFHRLSGHSYPHRPASAVPAEPVSHRADIDAALADLGETFDIDREDLMRLVQRVEHHARVRGEAPQPR